ncbi:MAG: alcohol dehydrogenase catalytic domain-containing protein [Blautia sp.]|nr:alcohol dehydrogenase catalytic domain-containing protein [Blautia sp.]
MKAVCLKAPFTVCIEEVPIPERKPGEALLKILSASLCGSDVNAYRGGGKKFSYPSVIGHEVVAEVAGIDDGRPFKKGDRVLINPYVYCGKCYPCSLGHTNCCESLQVLGCGAAKGAMSEFFVHPDHLLVPLPDSIDLLTAPLAEPLAIALHGLHQAGIGQSMPTKIEYAVIIGAGSIGLLAAMACRHFGVAPILIDILDSRLSYAASLGFTYTINSASRDAVQAISEITNGVMAKAVLEMSGATAAIQSTLSYASYCGTIAYTGWPSSMTTLDTSLITLKELTLKGARTATSELAEAVTLIEEHKIDVSPILTRTVTLEEIPAALKALSDHPEEYLKITALF